MTRVLTQEIYTFNAIDQGLTAFASHCDAKVEFGADESTITIHGDDRIAAELLNYILTLSAAEILA